jgi:hypothetical protein
LVGSAHSDGGHVFSGLESHEQLGSLAMGDGIGSGFNIIYKINAVVPKINTIATTMIAAFCPLVKL